MKVFVIYDPLFEKVVGVASTGERAEIIIQKSHRDDDRDSYYLEYDEYEIDRLLDD